MVARCRGRCSFLARTIHVTMIHSPPAALRLLNGLSCMAARPSPQIPNEGPSRGSDAHPPPCLCVAFKARVSAFLVLPSPNYAGQSLQASAGEIEFRRHASEASLPCLPVEAVVGERKCV